MAVFLGAATKEEYYADTGVTTYECAPCDSNYACEAFELVASGGPRADFNYLAYYKLVQNICADSSYDVFVTWDGFATYGNTFSIYANDVLIWTTGCVTGSGTATVTIPAGTKKLKAEVIGACNTPGEDEWSFSVICF